MEDQIDNPAMHIRCRCGMTYYDLDNNNSITCDCDFYREYERHRWGEHYEDNQREADDIVNDMNDW